MTTLRMAVVGRYPRPRHLRRSPLAAADRITQFSELRWRIMQMAADGLSNPEIAYLTGRSRRVICWHLDATYRRLNLRNRVQLATWMAEKG